MIPSFFSRCARAMSSAVRTGSSFGSSKRSCQFASSRTAASYCRAGYVSMSNTTAVRPASIACCTVVSLTTP
jgi:hypothetical protein